MYTGLYVDILDTITAASDGITTCLVALFIILCIEDKSFCANVMSQVLTVKTVRDLTSVVVTLVKHILVVKFVVLFYFVFVVIQLTD